MLHDPSKLTPFPLNSRPDSSLSKLTCGWVFCRVPRTPSEELTRDDALADKYETRPVQGLFSGSPMDNGPGIISGNTSTRKRAFPPRLQVQFPTIPDVTKFSELDSAPPLLGGHSVHTLGGGASSTRPSVMTSHQHPLWVTIFSEGDAYPADTPIR